MSQFIIDSKFSKLMIAMKSHFTYIAAGKDINGDRIETYTLSVDNSKVRISINVNKFICWANSEEGEAWLYSVLGEYDSLKCLIKNWGLL